MAFLDKSIRNLGGGISNYHQKNDTLLGLVFNESSIQLAEIKTNQAGQVLKKIVYWRVDTDGLDSKNVTENITFYSKQIQQALDEANITSANVAVVLPIGSVEIATIITPLFNDSELNELASDASFFSEFMGVEPEALTDKSVSYQILEQDSARGESVILLGLIEKKLLDSYLEITRYAGLSPVIVDVDLLAVANAYWAGNTDKSKANSWHGYLYYDGTKKTFIMLTDGIEVRIKDIEIAEADLILINQLADLDDESNKGAFWDELADRVSVHFLPFIEEIEKEFVVDIQSLFYYVAGENSIALEKLLKDRLKGLKLMPVNPFDGIDIPESSKKYVDAVDNKSFFAPLIGGSKRRLNAFVKSSAQELPFRLNFSPLRDSLERSTRFSLVNRFLTYGVLGVFSLFILWFGVSDIPKYLLQRDKVNQFEQLTRQIEQETPQLVSLQGTINNLKKQISGLQSIGSNHSNYLRSLISIGDLRAETTVLSDIEYIDGRYALKGEEFSLAKLVHFMGKLENDTYIKKVTLIKYEGSEFEILVELEQKS